jgi:hypothetical protein
MRWAFCSMPAAVWSVTPRGGWVMPAKVGFGEWQVMQRCPTIA